ncbi:MAG TPA: hypothetical protein VD864_15380, partial [Nocardioides sp.]|nr:hypothetical protein [Nocardioides sp.]
MSEPISPLRTWARFVLGVVLLTSGALTGTAASSSPAAADVAVPDCASAGYEVTSLGGPNFYIDAGSTPEFRSAYTGYRVVNQTGAAASDLYLRMDGFTGGSLGLAAGQPAGLRLGDLGAAAGQSLFWYLTAQGASAIAQAHTVTVFRHDPTLPTAVALCSTTGGFAGVETTLSAAANKVTGISLTGGAPKLGSTFTITVTGETGQIGQGIAGDAYSMWMSPAVTENWPAGAFRLLSTSLTMSPDGTAPAQTWTDRLRAAGLGTTSRPYTASYTF